MNQMKIRGLMDLLAGLGDPRSAERYPAVDAIEDNLTMHFAERLRFAPARGALLRTAGRVAAPFVRSGERRHDGRRRARSNRRRPRRCAAHRLRRRSDPRRWTGARGGRVCGRFGSGRHDPGAPPARPRTFGPSPRVWWRSQGPRHVVDDRGRRPLPADRTRVPPAAPRRHHHHLVGLRRDAGGVRLRAPSVARRAVLADRACDPAPVLRAGLQDPRRPRSHDHDAQAIRGRPRVSGARRKSSTLRPCTGRVILAGSGTCSSRRFARVVGSRCICSQTSPGSSSHPPERRSTT